MDSRIIRMGGNGVAVGGGTGRGFCVFPACELHPEDYDDDVITPRYSRPGSFPVLVRPWNEQPIWVASTQVFFRSEPFKNLRLEGGFQNECWNVVTFEPGEVFAVPSPPRVVLVPWGDPSSVWAGAVDIPTAAPSGPGSPDLVNWLVLRPGVRELQLTFTGTTSRTLTFWIQTAFGQLTSLVNTYTPSTDGTILQRAFPGTRLWVQANGAGCRVWADALVEAG